jgi:hypothetical protein
METERPDTQLAQEAFPPSHFAGWVVQSLKCQNMHRHETCVQVELLAIRMPP